MVKSNMFSIFYSSNTTEVESEVCDERRVADPDLSVTISELESLEDVRELIKLGSLVVPRTACT